MLFFYGIYHWKRQKTWIYMHCESSVQTGQRVCIYILSRLQSPAFIHFKVQFFAVSHGSQHWTTPDIIHTRLMKETKMAISRKKKNKTVIWGEVRQLFFTMNTEKIIGKHNRVEWPGSRVVVTVIHWSQSVTNLPHTILFSSTYWILF